MKKNSWDFFKCYNQNFTNDFERLTKEIFKRRVLNNKNAILTKISNHPGIETDPYELNGEKYAYQSKFFESLNYDSYKQLAESLEKIKNVDIDVLYIFSNKDINIDYKSCKRFLYAINFLKNKKVKINKICNDEILDLVFLNPDYLDLKCIYFNEYPINIEEINGNLNKQLNDLSPRYISDFNIDVEVQKYFDVCINPSIIKYEISEFLNEIRNSIYSNKFDDNLIKNSILEKLDGLVNIEEYDLSSAYEWINIFSDDIKAIDEYRKGIKNNDPKASEKIYHCNRILYTINSLTFNSKPFLEMSRHNILMIEGDAGTGKSHLLGYEAEYLSKNGELVYLVLGQKMIYEMHPQEQFFKELGIRNSSVKEWIYLLENYCEYYQKKAFILFDAVNECKNNTSWVSFINELILYITSSPHIFLVFTIRKTYTKLILNESIRKKISEGEIVHAFHNGFKDVLDVAVPAFFNKYNIPIDSPELFEVEFTNPLLLKTYCEGYSSDYRGNPGNIFSLYENYLKKEEEKFDLYHQNSAQYKSQKILSAIAKVMYKNGFLHAHYSDICDDLPSGTNVVEYFDYLCREKIFITYYNDDISDEEVFMNYEKFGEFIIAKEAIKTTQNYEELVNWCKKSLLAMNEYGEIKYNSVGIFAAISVLAREKYNKEVLVAISEFEEACKKNKHLCFMLDNIYEEYLSLYKNTSDRSIHKNEFERMIKGLKINRNLTKNIFKLLIDLAGRSNELNVDYLHSKLITKTQNELDYYWTITINNLYDLPKLDYIIKYINSNKSIGENCKNKYANLLVWLFCSTNRILRDTASKALVRLMKNDFSLMYDLLVKFDKCNDLYVIERLLCCIYGAAMLSDNYDGATDVATYLYNKVFKNEYVISDILIRDHSNCIIDYINRHEALGLDLSITKPPYNSKSKINDYDLNDLISFYKNDSVHPSGISAILGSITPDIPNGNELFGIYGDFGRYTFQSRVRGFKVDSLDPYYYALNYIKNVLKYDEKLFGQYDMNCYSNDRHSHEIERIGKKYEWLAMYHVLALVSDNYKYDNYGNKEYHGTWNNYCREFDPSILIVSTSRRIYELKELPLNKTIKWSDTEEHGLELIEDDIYNLQNYLYGDWVTLDDSIAQYSSKGIGKSEQSYADTISSYFVPSDKIDDVLSLKDNKVFPNQDISLYELYFGEYYNSYAYLELAGNNSISVEVEKGIETKKEQVPSFNEVTMQLEFVDRDVAYPIKEEICKIEPTYFRYSWESEYDYSKDGVLSIKMPAKIIVDYFNLIQREPGLWYDSNNKLICADFSLVKDTSSSGLKIRKEYLEKYLAENKMTFVIDAYLERRYTKDAMYNKHKIKSRRVHFYLKDNCVIKNIYEEDEFGSI